MKTLNFANIETFLGVKNIFYFLYMYLVKKKGLHFEARKS